MWLVGSEPASSDVYLGTKLAAAAGPQPWHAVVAGFDDGLAQLEHRLGASRSGRPRWLHWVRPGQQLWLSGVLCRPFLLTLPAGAASELDLQRIAAATAPAQTGLDGPCRVWLAPPSGAQARLVVAVSERVMQACAAAIHRAGYHLIGVAPWWAGVLNAVLDRTATPSLELLGVRDCDSLTVLAGQAGQFSSAMTRAPLTDEASAAAAWLRALSGQPVEPGRSLCVQFDMDAVGRSAAPDAGRAADTGRAVLGMRWARVQP